MAKRGFAVKIILAFFLLVSMLGIAGAIPQTFNVHGRLTNAAEMNISGTYIINFSIYNSPTAGNVLWSSGNMSVTTDASGVYNVVLQNVNLAFPAEYYLAVRVENDNEMLPRINLTSTPYAFTSNVSENLNATGIYLIKNLSVTGTGTFDTINATGNITSSGFRFSPTLWLQKIANTWARWNGNFEVTNSVNISGNLNVSGNINGTLNCALVAGSLGSICANQTLKALSQGNNTYLNQTYGIYNLTYHTWAYNQSLRALSQGNATYMLLGSATDTWALNYTGQNLNITNKLNASSLSISGMGSFGNLNLTGGNINGNGVNLNLQVGGSTKLVIGTTGPVFSGNSLLLGGGAGVEVINRNGGTGTITITGNAGDVVLSPSGTERVRVSGTNGDVGIGSSSPNALLEVNGGVNISGPLNVSNIGSFSNLNVTNGLNISTLNIAGLTMAGGNLNVTNKLNASSLSVTGTGTFGNLNATNIIAEGYVNVTNNVTTSSICFTQDCSHFIWYNGTDVEII